MQSVEIEKQQSRRLVSGDSLYHSIAGVLGFELFTTQEVANKEKKTAYTVHHLTWDHYIMKL